MTPEELKAAHEAVGKMQDAIVILSEAEEFATDADLAHVAAELSNVRCILTTSARNLSRNLENV